jgi:hypothetical protein
MLFETDIARLPLGSATSKPQQVLGNVFCRVAAPAQHAFPRLPGDLHLDQSHSSHTLDTREKPRNVGAVKTREHPNAVNRHLLFELTDKRCPYKWLPLQVNEATRTIRRPSPVGSNRSRPPSSEASREEAYL